MQRLLPQELCANRRAPFARRAFFYTSRLDRKEKSIKKCFFIVEKMQRLLPQELRFEAPFALRKKGVFC